MSKVIKVAIVAVGNCANSLVQGRRFYKCIDENSPRVPGLMHNLIGGYRVGDIKLVAAFDVNANKIGKDIAHAIWVAPNNAKKFCEVPSTRVVVSPGFIGDGIAPHMQGLFPLREDPDHVVDILKRSGAEMLVSYLPVGSYYATRFYAQACLDAGVAFINAMPEFICSNAEWAEKFRQAGIPCAGDDVMSQVGATIINAMLLSLLRDRGAMNVDSSQDNFGGNMDFWNMTDAQRVVTKRTSKTDTLGFHAGASAKKITAGPAEYKKSLGDTKRADMIISGEFFGGFLFEIDLKLTVEDSPDSAGAMVDMIRLMKLSLDRGLSGYQEWSAYYCKHPLHFMLIPEAMRRVEKFIARA